MVFTLDCCLCRFTTFYWVVAISSCIAVLISETAKDLQSYGKLRIKSPYELRNNITGGLWKGFLAAIQNLLVPKRWFTHFYVVAVVWNSLILASVITLPYNDWNVLSLVRILLQPLLKSNCLDLNQDIPSDKAIQNWSPPSVLIPLMQIQVSKPFRP